MRPDIPDKVETVVEVVRVLTGDTATVRLPNGRDVFGYGGGAFDKRSLKEGRKLRAWMFVADFSRAELGSEAQEEP
jgi:hypothetical protein